MMGLLLILLTEIPRESLARQHEQTATREAARPYQEDSPLWVETGPDDPKTGLPKYPRKQTFSGSVGMSQRCQHRKHYTIRRDARKLDLVLTLSSSWNGNSMSNWRRVGWVKAQPSSNLN